MTAPQRYAFVCGLHRSGTSLITRCLMQHPGVSGFANTGAIEDEGQFLQSVLPLEIAFGSVGRFGFDARAHMTETSAFNTPQNAQKLMSEWRRSWDVTKPILIEKTPSNLLRMRLLNQFAAPTYFIIVTRHPVAACLATMKWTEGNLFSLLSHWVHCYKIARTDAALLQNVIWVSYEAFVREPRGEINRLLAFLGLEPHSGALPDVKNENEKYFHIWEDLLGDGDRAIRQVPPEHYRSLATRLRQRVGRELRELSLPPARRKASLKTAYDALDAAALFAKDVGEFGYSFRDLICVPPAKLPE